MGFKTEVLFSVLHPSRLGGYGSVCRLTLSLSTACQRLVLPLLAHATLQSTVSHTQPSVGCSWCRGLPVHALVHSSVCPLGPGQAHVGAAHTAVKYRARSLCPWILSKYRGNEKPGFWGCEPSLKAHKHKALFKHTLRAMSPWRVCTPRPALKWGCQVSEMPADLCS